MSSLLYKHQWNTRWAFAWKVDIFTCENNMLSSHVKISPLLWLHNKSHISHKKTIKVKWFGISLVFIIINGTLYGRLEIRNFSFHIEKIFHSFAVLYTRKIYFNTRRKILYRTWNFLNFTYVIKILVKFDIHFRRLPWEISLVLLTDDLLHFKPLKNVKKIAIFFKYYSGTRFLSTEN